MLVKEDGAKYLRNLLGQEKFFKNFENIDYDKMDKIINTFRITINQVSTDECINELSNKYYTTLKVISFEKLTFDEKLFAFINIIDPELKMAEVYNNLNIPTNKEINKISTTQDKAKLMVRKDLLEKKYSDYLFENFGTRSKILLKYELKLLKASLIKENKEEKKYTK